MFDELRGLGRAINSGNGCNAGAEYEAQAEGKYQADITAIVYSVRNCSIPPPKSSASI